MKLKLICIYNNQKVLDDCIKASIHNLKPDDSILINNIGNKSYSSYSGALRPALEKVHDDDVLIISHQDVFYMDSQTRKKILEFTKGKKEFFAGVVGVKKFKRKIQEAGINNIYSGSERIGFKEIEKPTEVVSIDGCVIITNKRTITRCNLFKDEKLGWHFYDVDSCLQVQRLKLKVYCLPILIDHRHGVRTNQSMENYFKLIPYLLLKHKKITIYSVCGKWNLITYAFEFLKHMKYSLLKIQRYARPKQKS